ncbi:hypothetical protein [Roseivirga sp. UBA1976]|uniref:hypothetical protein n=1 Tax=Roseivirga sp. UBA1976 TaxID=1947386 RepID=UPI00257A578F|nr:hypothetical protein [Roseivirga sp. UBA1976]|tara:strand:- start:12007 stop:12234 length:228 start_codon:yes stop_codon:yes gene_type:complete
MNKERRQRINYAIEALENLTVHVEEVAVDEEEAFFNMPESLQESEKGERMQEVIDELNEVSTELADMIDRLKNCL